MQMHISTILIWTYYQTILGAHNHLGFEVPYIFFLFPPVAKHDFHHELPVNEMYGKNSISDYLFGTDKRYKASLENKKRQQQAIRNVKKNKKVD